MNSKITIKAHFLSVRFEILVCLVITIALMITYWGIWNYEFINFDDSIYITKNTNIKTGMTKENILWAFSNTYACWQPLAWLSHTLDCELFGVDSGMHHLVNLIFHIINAILLFLVFNKMTRMKWESALIAILFALHPLSVDSVAWIAERKNVLSTFWWILGIWSYSHYVEKPNLFRYIWPLIFFVFGLMTKPMCVTMPFVFLLLDYWPLGKYWVVEKNADAYEEKPLRDKLKDINISHRVLEKIPFFITIAIYFYFFFVTLDEMGTIAKDSVSISLRISNALTSYILYFWKTVWPQGLSIFYPFPKSIPIWQSIGSALLLILITLPVVRLVKKMPYLMVGWSWYLGTLVPVIGLIQSGNWPRMADRWMYVPQIGIYIMVVFGISKMASALQFSRRVIFCVTSVLLIVMMTVSWFQVRHWKNSKTIFQHALDVNQNNMVAHNNLGIELLNIGRVKEAAQHFKIILKSNPNNVGANFNLGLVLYSEGELEKAAERFLAALKTNPNYFSSHKFLALVFQKLGREDQAMKHYKEALRIKPESSDVFIQMGMLYSQQNHLSAAAKCFRAAIRHNPENEAGYHHLAIIQFETGYIKNAIKNLKKAIQLDPGNADAYNDYGVFLYKMGNIKDSINNLKKALKINPRHIDAGKNLKKIMENVKIKS